MLSGCVGRISDANISFKIYYNMGVRFAGL